MRFLLLSLLLIFARFSFALEPKIAASLQPFVESHTLAGAVTVVASKEKVLSIDSVGFADIAANQPMQADKLFWIASMSKPITGAGLMILVDEGKVNIEDPIEKYLPEFKDQWQVIEQDGEHTLLRRPTKKVTIEHLLSHTSGMPFKSLMEQPTLDQLRLRDAVRSYALVPLQWEPGSKYQYSNAGINTAARVIEVVTGMSYEAFMDQRLFAPLGMKDTTFWPSAEQLTRLAKPYKPNADKTNLEETTISQLTYPLNERTRQPMPAGGLFSTGEDVASFCRMVLNEGEFEGKRILTAAAVKQMTSRHTGEHIKEGYGLGWSTGGTSFGHGGALSTNMNIDTQRGLITIYLVQHAGYPNTDGGKIQPAFVNAALQAFGK